MSKISEEDGIKLAFGILESEVEKYKKRLKVAKEPDEKKFAEKKLKNAEKELQDAKDKLEKMKSEKKGSSKKGTSKATVPAKMPKVKKPAKPAKGLRTVTIDNKTYTEKDKEFCQILIKEFEKRRESMKKAAKKHKTVSVSSKISRGIAHAVETAIENIPAADIKSSPKVFITKVRSLEKAAKEFVNAFKSILGDDFDRQDIQSELAAITEMVDKIKSKYK